MKHMLSPGFESVALSTRKHFLLHTLILISLGIFIYSNTFVVPFILDDTANIVENPAIRNWSYFLEPSKITETSLPQVIKDTFQNRYIGYLSFAVNYHLHGYKLAGYHITNLTIHLINTLLVYWLVILTFRTPAVSAHSGGDDESRDMALFVALLFVCHPLQTQAVTYIVQRFASLATLFYLSAISFYIRSRLAKSTARPWLYLASILSTVFSMRTKEISFTLPLMIVLFEVMFFNSKRRTRLYLLTPFLLTLAIIPIAALSQKGGFMESMNISNHVHLNRWDYLFTQFSVLVTYLGLFFPPVIQNLDYDYPIYHSFTEPAVILSFLFVLFLLAVGLYLYFRSRSASPYMPYNLLISFGIFWFFITLSSESTIIPIADVIFEHRLYLPSTGFFIAITSAGMLIMQRFSSDFPILRKVVPATAFAFILLLSGAAYARNSVWRSEISIWQDTVKKSPKKARPHHNLGLALQINHQLDDAVKEYRITLSIKPDYEGAHLNIGSIYYQRGLFSEALNEYQKALTIRSDSCKAHNNIGIIYSKQGRFDDALREFQVAAELNTDYADPYNNRGLIYFKKGRFHEALAEFESALRKKPDFAEAQNNRGNAYLLQGCLDDAIKAYQLVKEMDPDYIGIYLSIADVYHRQGRLDEAFREYQTALDLKPDYSEAQRGIERLQKESRASNLRK